ncbi:O-antigen ligase family protein [Belliella pelovolcani]|uniref:O-Antigen ligase n=1 Tax=Belliella pelovolcani TaxID=529505 RepID=A0A1N7KHP2_9BACT|nr:O-antigen ligase family protein [Belliella pelovolcani]SIS61105.1 O-Antigen ligase [Belliella pelovolcani]
MLFIIFFITVFILCFITFKNIVFRGKWEYVIFFAAMFFPFYITIISTVYSTTKSIVIFSIFQYIKEIVMLIAFIGFFVYQKNLSNYPLRLNGLDYSFIFFYLLVICFLILPIGEATVYSKLLYFKNVALMGLFYFFGRNSHFDDRELKKLLHAILLIAGLALTLNIIEFSIDTHFQQYTGYAVFNEEINNISPKGNHGLTWTFETPTYAKRFASFFSDPLELAISSIMMFATALIMYLTTKRGEATPYLFMIGATAATLVFSYSRSSMAALLVMLVYISFLFKLYKIIFAVIAFVLTILVYILFFSSDEFRYFLIDTITLQDSSSLGHLVEWLAAIESMISNPMGIGLATSGNIGAVDEELRVGGENQFLVFGVQIGWIGMILYILMLFGSIVYCYKAFGQLKNTGEARIAFIATTVKFAAIFPLFTSNAEKFLFVSLITWWMVGYTVNAIHRQKLKEIISHG